MASGGSEASGVAQKTFNTWQQTLDPGKRWLHAEIVERQAVRVWCALCAKHVERLKGFRNFSEAFVTGITGASLKRDNVSKHMTTSAHLRAEALETGPLPISDVLQNTVIGKLNACLSVPWPYFEN